MELPASSSGQPSTPGQKATSATPIALTPGQIVSARVLEALGADTYLLALRGRTLVANSPTPLTPDTVVQLAVQAADNPESPVPVKLLATAARNDRDQEPTAATRVAAMIAELGLPPGPAAALTIAAFTRLGVPLADPRTSGQARPSLPLRSVVQLVQAAIDTGGAVEKAIEGMDADDRPTPPETVIQTSDAPVNRAAPRTASTSMTGINPTPSSGTLVDTSATAKVIATAHTPTVAPVAASPLAASVDPHGAEGPPATKKPPARGFSALATQTTTSATKPAVIPQPANLPAGNIGAESRTDVVRPTLTWPAHTATVPHLGAQNVVPAAAAAPVASPTPHLGESSTGNPLSPVAPIDHPASDPMTVAEKTTAAETTENAARGDETASPEEFQRRVRQSASDRSLQQVPAASAAEDAPLAETYGPRLPRAPKLIHMPVAEAPRRAALASSAATPALSSASVSSASVSSGTISSSARSPSGMARLAATMTPSELATAGARLARVSLPVTPATLAVALRAPTEQPAAIARWVPAALAQAIDPAIASPTTAMHAALQLAGVVPANMANDPAQTLLQHLIRIAIGVGSAGPLLGSKPLFSAPAETLAAPSAATAAATAAATSADPAAHAGLSASTSAAAPDEAREPVIGFSQTTDETPLATGPSLTADSALTAVRDVAAEHLLPPTHLDDYDRIIPLPMMHAGQPVPARLAVTTRRTASGGMACWMRVDCALSYLGSVSVRLSGADGGPVAVTLIAAPAAAAVLAQALPALTHDLHAKGVVAALRVVADDGDPTAIT